MLVKITLCVIAALLMLLAFYFVLYLSTHYKHFLITCSFAVLKLPHCFLSHNPITCWIFLLIIQFLPFTLQKIFLKCLNMITLVILMTTLANLQFAAILKIADHTCDPNASIKYRTPLKS